MEGHGEPKLGLWIPIVFLLHLIPVYYYHRPPPPSHPITTTVRPHSPTLLLPPSTPTLPPYYYHRSPHPPTLLLPPSTPPSHPITTTVHPTLPPYYYHRPPHPPTLLLPPVILLLPSRKKLLKIGQILGIRNVYTHSVIASEQMNNWCKFCLHSCRHWEVITQ